MTKQEVLQGALALNCSDKKYTVTVEDDKIIIEVKYRGSRVRESTFRCIAQLKDDKTYTESTCNYDGYCRQYGVRKKAVSYCWDGSKEVFDSEEIKKVLRDYLESCGYKKTKNTLMLALCITIPVVAILPQHRNKGFGKILLKQLIENLITSAISGSWELKELNVSCDSDSLPSVKMYKAVGFSEEYSYPQAYLPKQK